MNWKLLFSPITRAVRASSSLVILGIISNYTNHGLALGFQKDCCFVLTHDDR